MKPQKTELDNFIESLVSRDVPYKRVLVSGESASCE